MVAMITKPRMRLAEGIRHDDRRMFRRTASNVTATATRMDHTIAARLQPALELHLRDISAGGLSATSATPLTMGEHVTVAFPRNGTGAAWDAFGRVVRCNPNGAGYCVAVAFDPLPAA